MNKIFGDNFIDAVKNGCKITDNKIICSSGVFSLCYNEVFDVYDVCDSDGVYTLFGLKPTDSNTFTVYVKCFPSEKILHRASERAKIYKLVKKQ